MWIPHYGSNNNRYGNRWCLRCRTSTHNTRECFWDPNNRTRNYSNNQNNPGVIRIPANNNNNNNNSIATRNNNQNNGNNNGPNYNNNGNNNQNSGNNNQNSGNDRHMVMRETRPGVKEIYLQTEISKTELEMFIDGGASKNYISKEWVDKLNLTPKDDIKITTEFANNSVEESDKSVSVKVYIPLIKKERLVRFYVLNDCKRVLTLGLEFLCDNEIVVDYGKGELKLEGKIHHF